MTLNISENRYQELLLARRKKFPHLYRKSPETFRDSDPAANRERVAELQAIEAGQPAGLVHTDARDRMMKRIARHYRKERSKQVFLWTKRTGNRAAAEDYVQKGYENAVRHWDTFTDDAEPDAFNKWMNTVTNNAAKKQVMKDNVRKRMFVELDGAMLDPKDLEEQVIKRRDMAMVQAAIATERERTQEIVCLYFFNQETEVEIAKRFGFYDYTTVRKLITAFKKRHGLA